MILAILLFSRGIFHKVSATESMLLAAGLHNTVQSTLEPGQVCVQEFLCKYSICMEVNRAVFVSHNPQYIALPPLPPSLSFLEWKRNPNAA